MKIASDIKKYIVISIIFEFTLPNIIIDD